jgi:hypothetical protein
VSCFRTLISRPALFETSSLGPETSHIHTCTIPPLISAFRPDQSGGILLWFTSLLGYMCAGACLPASQLESAIVLLCMAHSSFGFKRRCQAASYQEAGSRASRLRIILESSRPQVEILFADITASAWRRCSSFDCWVSHMVDFIQSSLWLRYGAVWKNTYGTEHLDVGAMLVRSFFLVECPSTLGIDLRGRARFDATL